MQGLGDRIRHLRNDISQQNYAKSLGISPRALFSYEREERIPGADLIVRICAKSGASFKWLLTGEGPIYESEAKDTPARKGIVINIDPAVQLVNEALEEAGIELSDVQKKAVVDVVREELLSKTRKIAQAISGD